LRVLRCRKDLTASTEAFVDTLVPGRERKIHNLVVGGITKDPSMAISCRSAAGTDPDRISWAPQVLAAAMQTPLRLDEHGNVT